MNPFLLLISFSLLCMVAGCKSRSSFPAQTTEKRDTLLVQPAIIQSLATIATNDTNRFSVVISFFSQGSGAPFEVMTEFDAFMTNYSSPNGKKPVFERVPWGREGELDYCIRLDKFDEADKNDFLRQAGAITKKTTLVHIYHNTECRHRKVKD